MCVLTFSDHVLIDGGEWGVISVAGRGQEESVMVEMTCLIIPVQQKLLFFLGAGSMQLVLGDIHPGGRFGVRSPCCCCCCWVKTGSGSGSFANGSLLQ